MNSGEINNAVSEYELQRPAYERLCEENSELIEGAFEQANIDIAGFSERTKSVESFREKIARKKYDNPLDQIGFRGRSDCLSL